MKSRGPGNRRARVSAFGGPIPVGKGSRDRTCIIPLSAGPRARGFDAVAAAASCVLVVPRVYLLPEDGPGWQLKSRLRPVLGRSSSCGSGGG